MRVLIRKCDRCGKTISEQTAKSNGIFKPEPPKYIIEFSENTKESSEICEAHEICDECAISFLDWMKKKDTAVVKPPLDAPKTLDIPEKRPIKLKPGTRTHHIWTNEDDDFLLYHSAGLTVKQIAYKLGVTVCAVYNRKARLLNGEV